VVGEYDVEVDGEARHVLYEQVQRCTSLQRKPGRLEDRGRDGEQESHGLDVVLVHERLRSRRSPDLETAIQRFPPPSRWLWRNRCW